MRQTTVTYNCNTVRRTFVPESATETCGWCGSERKRFFRYDDDWWKKVFDRPGYGRGLGFCNLGCWNSYYW